MKRRSFPGQLGYLSLYAAALLSGCSNLLLLNPKGPIGDAERFVIIAAFVLMLIVVLPVFVMAFWFTRKYRASNSKATYSPKWSYSAKVDLVIWLVPIAIVTALACLAWNKTHQLDPFRPIDPGIPPTRIEVVSLNWKWLFIYPDHEIAAVGQFVFPANVPLSLSITSDSVMTSFFIPQLGSQIYAMAGRQTRLHLMADEKGTYDGHNQQFSGRGYSDMNFKAIATSREEFEAWLKAAKQSPDKLDLARYQELEKPSVGYPVTVFSSVTPDLFNQIIDKYLPKNKNTQTLSRKSGSLQTKTGTVGGK